MSTESQLTPLLVRNLVRWYLGESMCLRTTVYGREPKTFLWFSFYHTVLIFSSARQYVSHFHAAFYEIWRKTPGESVLYHHLTPMAREEAPKNVCFIWTECFLWISIHYSKFTDAVPQLAPGCTHCLPENLWVMSAGQAGQSVETTSAWSCCKCFCCEVVWHVFPTKVTFKFKFYNPSWNHSVWFLTFPSSGCNVTVMLLELRTFKGQLKMDNVVFTRKHYSTRKRDS